MNKLHCFSFYIISKTNTKNKLNCKEWSYWMLLRKYWSNVLYYFYNYSQCYFVLFMGWNVYHNEDCSLTALYIFKVYKAIKITKNFSERGSQSIKMLCINIRLNIDLFTFNKCCICKLLYMTVKQKIRIQRYTTGCFR